MFWTEENWYKPLSYAAKYNNDAERISSQSGGMFKALSDYFFDINGVVYGVIADENFNAIHARIENKANSHTLQKSKYIQSRIGDSFRYVKADLDQNKLVLFSGTSCQIAGLKDFLGTDYKNLFCVDIICHGVPSSKLWQDYLKWNEKKQNAHVFSAVHRDKIKFGWHSHTATLNFDNGETVSNTVFTELFYGHNVLRPCCYECPFKSVMHPGDITIGDCWGIEKADPAFDDNGGVSLVLINNEKAMRLFESIKDSLICKQVEIDDYMQPPLKAPFPRPKNREKFWNDYRNKNFEFIAKKYTNYGILNRMKCAMLSWKHHCGRLVRHIIR